MTEKVKELKEQHKKMWDEIAELRQRERGLQNQYLSEQIKRLVHGIDDELGPFRWSNKPFYLE